MSIKIICLTRFCSLIAIFVGFMLQSWEVTEEYFFYKTVSVVTIEDYPDVVMAPSLALCARFDIDGPHDETKIGKLFKDYFNDGNDTWRVYQIWSDALNNQPAEMVYSKFLRESNYDLNKLWLRKFNFHPINHQVKKYFRANKYCLLLNIKDKFIASELFSPQINILPYFYRAAFSTEPFFSKKQHVLQDKECHPRHVYIQVLPDLSMISSAKIPTQMIRPCTLYTSCQLAYLAYQELISVKLPAPYDTNCHDYTRSDLLSSHDCYDKCMKKQTLPWNILLQGSLIERTEYLTSEFDIAPLHLIKNPPKLDKLFSSNSTIDKNLLKRYRDVSQRWKNMTTFCRSKCIRSDCVSHRITPHILAREESVMDNRTSLNTILLTLRITEQPIVHVESVAKQRLIDFIIYISSGLSFWLGFCPLSFSGWIEEKVRKLMSSNRRTRRTRRNRTGRRSNRLQPSRMLSQSSN